MIRARTLAMTAALAGGLLAQPASAEPFTQSCGASVCIATTMVATKTTCGPQRADGTHVCGWDYQASFSGSGLPGSAHGDLYIYRDGSLVRSTSGDCTWVAGSCTGSLHEGNQWVIVNHCDEVQMIAVLSATAWNSVASANTTNVDETITFNPTNAC